MNQQGFIAELGYLQARSEMGKFLERVGRRKLIMPTYTALAASEDGLAFAKQVFERARPGYHPITTGSVEKVIAEAKPVAREVPAAKRSAEGDSAQEADVPAKGALKVEGQMGKPPLIEDPAKPPAAATQ